jgi:hypothetical protein
MAHNRTLARAAAATLLAVGAAACSTAVSGHGELAAGSGPVRSGTSGGTPAVEGATPGPTVSPPVRLDTISKRRITCLLVLPSVAKAVTDWNSYLEHQGGTRESVAASLSVTAAMVDTAQGSSQLPAADPVRGGSAKLVADLTLMAQTLRRGGIPPVSRFNADKRRLQASCPS